jgi:hypothetical protein
MLNNFVTITRNYGFQVRTLMYADLIVIFITILYRWMNTNHIKINHNNICILKLMFIMIHSN